LVAPIAAIRTAPPRTSRNLAEPATRPRRDEENQRQVAARRKVIAVSGFIATNPGTIRFSGSKSKSQPDEDEGRESRRDTGGRFDSAGLHAGAG
jgi:hypothetical protein